MYACFLDAQKAFDAADYCKIFRLLLLRGIPSSVVHLILKWYEGTDVRVHWNGAVSTTSFTINHGVRQGGLLSPALFSVLYDELLDALELSGEGCIHRRRYYGAIAYADDLALLAPSATALRRMLTICEAWSIRNHIRFNPSKSSILIFSVTRGQPHPIPLSVTLFGQQIPVVNEVLHLGHRITFSLDDSAELMRIAKAFNRQFHGFLSRFCDLRHKDVLIPLYQTYCSSFYGLESTFQTCASVASVKFLRKSVNLSLMRLLDLPRESVSQFLIAHGILNSDATWRTRSLNFWRRLMQGDTAHRSLLLTAFTADIVQLALSVHILPCSIPHLSKTRIEQHCIDKWLRVKDLC